MLGSKETNTRPLSRWIIAIHRDLQKGQNKRARHLMTGAGTTGINGSKAKSGWSERTRVSRSWEAGAGNVGDSALDAVVTPRCLRLMNIWRAAQRQPEPHSSGVLTETPKRQRNARTELLSSPLKAVHPVRKLRSQKHVSAPEQGASQFLHPWLNEKDDGWMVCSFLFHHQSKA